MFLLIQKLAWYISLIAWFIITFFIGIMMGILDSRYAFDGDTFLIWVIFTIFFWCLFKKFFLSKKYILWCVQEDNFTTNILNPLEKHTDSINDLDQLDSIQAEPIEEANKEKENKQEDSIQKNIQIPLSWKHEEQKIEVHDYPKETIKNEPNAIQKFFWENLIAKLWGIIFFFGCVFFLNLVYSNIWEVGKMIIGFLIAGGVFFAWLILDKKSLINESRILMGLAILINYWVILSGRFILWDSIDNSFLWIWTTFIFLVLNTIFAVITSLVYNSKNLLLFAFIFAFLNPFLIWGTSQTPYMLIWYTLIISYWALILGTFDRLQKSSKTLLYTTLFGWNILLYMAPFWIESEFIVKMIAFIILNLSIVYTTYINSSQYPYRTWTQYFTTVFISIYVFFIFQISSGNFILASWLENIGVFISYISTLFLLFGFSAWLLISWWLTFLFATLFIPLLILLGLILTGSLLFPHIIIAATLIFYLFIFSNIHKSLQWSLKYVFFIALAIFLIIANISFKFNIYETIALGNIPHLIASISTLIFLLSSYLFAKKKDQDYLYTIGTLWAIFSLIPILSYQTSSIQTIVSILTLWIFALGNIFYPFYHTQLLKHNIKNLAIALTAGWLFIILQFFTLSQIYFPWITLGFVYMWLALLYFSCGYKLVWQLNLNKSTISTVTKNTVYAYLWICISIITIAIAVIFSNTPEIIAWAWIIEACVLLYFYKLSKEIKVYYAAIILYLIGAFQFANFTNIVEVGQYLSFLSIGAIYTAMISWLISIKWQEFQKHRTAHDILHIIMTLLISTALIEILPVTGYGLRIAIVSITILICSLVYSRLWSKLLQQFFLLILISFSSWHIWASEMILDKIQKDNMDHFLIFQYITTIIIWKTLWIWHKYSQNLKNWVLFTGIIYIFIITSIYIYDIFNSTFAITLYWWLAAFIILKKWIWNDIIKYRTLWLYLLFWTLGKIFLHDLWVWFDNALFRVFALMIIWALMFIISSLYSKKYGNNLKWEFNLSNLQNPHPKATDIFPLNQKIEKINIDGISSIKFQVNWDTAFTTKAKNLLRIVKFVTENTQKYDFEAGELLDTYNYIVKNYHSQLNKRDIETIQNAIKNFVDKGWKVEIKK